MKHKYNNNIKTTTMSSTTRVYKKTPKVIRHNLTSEQKKLIMKFISTHKKAINDATKEAKKEAKIAEKEAKKEAKIAEKEAKKKAKIAEKDAMKKAKKAEKKANGIKRKPSAFANYMKTIRTSVKNENPDASFGDISKIVGEKWKNLTNEEKQQYKVE